MERPVYKVEEEDDAVPEHASPHIALPRATEADVQPTNSRGPSRSPDHQSQPHQPPQPTVIQTSHAGPLILSKRMQRIVEIEEMWWQKVKPDIELDAVPIQEQCNNVEFITAIESEGRRGGLFVHPLVLCIPFAEGILDGATLEQAWLARMTESPALEVPHWNTAVPVHGIIAAKCFSRQNDGAIPRFKHSCQRGACMLPQHVVALSSDKRREHTFTDCRFTSGHITENGPIPLYCPDHGPECRPASAVISEEETVVACWMYYNGLTSLDQAPRHMLGSIPEELLDSRLRTFRLEADGGEDSGQCYMYYIHTKTLREYVQGQDDM